jgi:4-hydroxy-3-methylbut-2-enyl diphosphate reductase
MKPEIIIAAHSGYCYGVERAIKLAQKALSEGSKVVSLGPIIHNPVVVKELRENGITVVEDVEKVPKGAVVIIRSHGVPPEVYDRLKAKKVNIIDATCPYVRRAQLSAKKLSEEGYHVLIIGEKEHPEVIGIKGYAGENAQVVETLEELKTLKPIKKLGVVFQTTQSLEIIDVFAAEILKKAYELKIYNTICSATTNRQNSTREIAAKADAVVVVGGKNSGNTKRLYEIAKSINKRVYHVETADELRPEWFEGALRVGITAGASTPKEIVLEVARAVGELGQS